MKKIFTIIALMGISIASQAQQYFNPFQNKDAFNDMLRSGSILFLIYLLTSFVINIVKLFLDNRLKKAIVEKGAPENVISQLMPGSQSDKKGALKWFIILTCVAVGLTLISFTQPMGFHSVIIMTFSIAFGFLGYFFLLKRTDK